VQIDVLGPFAVRVEGRAVAPREFGGRLARRLVRVLAASPGRLVTREVLIDALWRADRPADPDANLNVLVNRARAPGLAHGTAATTTPCSRQVTRGAAARRNTLVVPRSNARQRRTPPPLS
jgi:DNA-binding SARP family transcriptional activator